MLVEGAQGLGFQYWLRGAAFEPSADPLSLRCFSLSACLCQGLGRSGCICVCLSDTFFGFFTQSITLLTLCLQLPHSSFLPLSLFFIYTYVGTYTRDIKKSLETSQRSGDSPKRSLKCF